MKKIRLDLAKLSVESFSVSSSVPGRGTVKGHLTEGGGTCDAQASCGPQTCVYYCVIATENPLCSGATTGSVAADSCDECLSVWTYSPLQCPCA